MQSFLTLSLTLSALLATTIDMRIKHYININSERFSAELFCVTCLSIKMAHITTEWFTKYKAQSIYVIVYLLGNRELCFNWPDVYPIKYCLKCRKQTYTIYVFVYRLGNSEINFNWPDVHPIKYSGLQKIDIHYMTLGFLFTL